MPLTTGNRSLNCKYIYDLPYVERKTLCNILDINDQWERLGGELMGFSVLDLSEIKRAERSGDSPTDRLLQFWGQKNNTIMNLYFLLYNMEHFQAMSVLEPFIPEQYHHKNLYSEHIPETDAKKNVKHNEAGYTLPKPSASLLVDQRPKTEVNSQQGRNKRYSNSEHSPLTVSRERDPNLLKETSESLIGSAKTKSKVPNHFLNAQKKGDRSQVPSGIKPLSIWNKEDSSSDKILNTVNPPQITKYGTYSSNEDNLEANNENDPSLKQAEGYSPKDKNVSNNKELLNQAVGAACPLSRKRYQSNCSEFSTISDCGVPMISYKELEDATSNWNKNQLLGSGGFGSVFKGTWINVNVAIKRINNSQKAIQSSSTSQMSQIMDELRFLQKYRHDNILQVYGFSADPGKPHCLVYQFMANGSLEYRLQCKKMEIFSETTLSPLTWHQRFTIAKGTAAALQFLHTVQEKPLIHGDVKSANILLDGYLQPKLGDFGLAREGPDSDYTSMKVSHVHGTRPYIPEEYLRSKKLSTKVDTYSFGIVLFEICSGRRAYSDKSRKFLRDDVLEATDKYSLIDSKAGLEDIVVFDILFNIGLECIHRVPKKRPDMTTVFQYLKDFSKQLMDSNRNRRISVEDYSNALSSQNPPNTYASVSHSPFVHPQRIMHPQFHAFSTSPPMPFPNQQAYIQHGVPSKSPVPPMIPISLHNHWMKGLPPIHRPSLEPPSYHFPHNANPTSIPASNVEVGSQKVRIPEETENKPTNSPAPLPLIPDISRLILRSSSEIPETEHSESSSSTNSSSESLGPQIESSNSQSKSTKDPGTSNVNKVSNQGSNTVTEICIPLLSQLGTINRPKTTNESKESSSNAVSAQGKKTFLD